MAAKPKPFATEVDLCKAFLSALPTEWTSYAETSGWDLLLVRKTDGLQVGIEAKLKLNTQVVSQVLEEYGRDADRPGPDHRAVLVPSGEHGFERIAAYIGFTIIHVSAAQPPYRRKPDFNPSLPGDYSVDRWHDWMPVKRHELPEYVPDVAAGASAPVQLTHWKIQALKLLVLADRRGFITRHDFRHLGIDHRRWISAEGWLRPTDVRGRYVVHHPAPTAFKDQHPRVYAEIAADFNKWAPTEPKVSA